MKVIIGLWVCLLKYSLSPDAWEWWVDGSSKTK